MNININELNVKRQLLIDVSVDFENENLDSLSIREVKETSFKGKLYYNSLDEIILEGQLHASLIMVDSVDLSDILYEIDVEIDEIITNFENTLDINEILWENIVLEVPMRITDKNLGDASGNGWKVKSDAEEDEMIDPRLAKLQELYKGGE
ncbi:MAG: YceD family protein [bacterium]